MATANPVVTVATGELIIAIHAEDDVVTAEASDAVGPGCAEDCVWAFGPKRDRPRLGDNYVQTASRCPGRIHERHRRSDGRRRGTDRRGRYRLTAGSHLHPGDT